jgi:hypothetical protein
MQTLPVDPRLPVRLACASSFVLLLVAFTFVSRFPLQISSKPSVQVAPNIDEMLALFHNDHEQVNLLDR